MNLYVVNKFMDQLPKLPQNFQKRYSLSKIRRISLRYRLLASNVVQPIVGIYLEVIGKEKNSTILVLFSPACNRGDYQNHR